MKKRVSILFCFLILVVSSACGQQPGRNNIPLLVQTTADAKAPYLEIITPCVEDTLCVYVTIMVRFDEKFSDSIKLTTPKEIYLYNISYYDKIIDKEEKNKTSQKPEEIVFEEFPYSEEDLRQMDDLVLQQPEQETPQEICVRKAVDAQFKIWLKEQPYSDMYGVERFYGYNAFSLSYPVFLIPRQ